MPARRYATTQTAYALGRPEGVGQLRATFLAAMRRNLATSGYVISFVPADHSGSGPTLFSVPGCFIASPSYPIEQTGVGGAPLDQDYVFNWTRDAALAAIELSFDEPPPGEAVSQHLVDYVTFARRCQDAAAASDVAAHDIGHPMYYVDGTPFPRGRQYDGPALQALAVLRCYPALSPAAQQDARTVIERNVRHVVDHHDDHSENLWEEVTGLSFFTRAVQLRCLREVQAQGAVLGLDLPDLDDALTALTAGIAAHWDEDAGRYTSVLEPSVVVAGYDPNIDIVMASVYGAVPGTDLRLLATAARIRDQWADPDAGTFYPINGQDAPDLGPLLGRYPGDRYDGDLQDANTQGHPWALCTANYAALYYRVAAALRAGELTFPLAADDVGDATLAVATTFFTGAGCPVDAGREADAATALVAAGDWMLDAVVYHSNHLELSEQFDKDTGFEKSVENLTWSYSAFLNALRARGDGL